MNTDIQAGTSIPFYGARAAGVTLILVVVSSLLGTLFISQYVDSIVRSGEFLLVNEYSPTELDAIHRVVVGVLNPLLLFVVTVLILKTYFPNEKLASIFARFGYASKPNGNLLISSFLFGILVVLFFTHFLMKIFPTPESATPHPANDIANLPLAVQLSFALFVVTVVPLIEEFLFRGVLYTGFANSMNKYIAAVFVTCIFIILHPDAIRSGYWVTHLSLYLIPIIFMAARMATGSLASSIMIHSGFNFGVLFL
jgi:membrane protease YdiL (CAAX protease family)